MPPDRIEQRGPEMNDAEQAELRLRISATVNHLLSKVTSGESLNKDVTDTLRLALGGKVEAARARFSALSPQSLAEGVAMRVINNVLEKREQIEEDDMESLESMLDYAKEQGLIYEGIHPDLREEEAPEAPALPQRSAEQNERSRRADAVFSGLQGKAQFKLERGSNLTDEYLLEIGAADWDKKVTMVNKYVQELEGLTVVFNETVPQRPVVHNAAEGKIYLANVLKSDYLEGYLRTELAERFFQESVEKAGKAMGVRFSVANGTTKEGMWMLRPNVIQTISVIEKLSPWIQDKEVELGIYNPVAPDHTGGVEIGVKLDPATIEQQLREKCPGFIRSEAGVQAYAEVRSKWISLEQAAAEKGWKLKLDDSLPAEKLQPKIDQAFALVAALRTLDMQLEERTIVLWDDGEKSKRATVDAVKSNILNEGTAWVHIDADPQQALQELEDINNFIRTETDKKGSKIFNELERYFTAVTGGRLKISSGTKLLSLTEHEVNLRNIVAEMGLLGAGLSGKTVFLNDGITNDIEYNAKFKYVNVKVTGDPKSIVSKILALEDFVAPEFATSYRDLSVNAERERQPEMNEKLQLKAGASSKPKEEAGWTNQDVYWGDRKRGVFMVADGVSGNKGGDVAATIASDYLASRPFDELESLTDEQQIRSWMFETLEQIHRTIRERAQADPELKGMKTTIALVKEFIDEDGQHKIITAKVGDVRVGLLRKGKFETLTLDASVTPKTPEWDAAKQKQDKLGEIDDGTYGGLSQDYQALWDNRTNVDDALGDEDDYIAIINGPVVLEAGDRFVLFTDGVRNLKDSEIAAVINDAQTVDRAASELTDKAQERSRDATQKVRPRKDDMTALVVELQDVAAADARYVEQFKTQHANVFIEANAGLRGKVSEQAKFGRLYEQVQEYAQAAGYDLSAVQVIPSLGRATTVRRDNIVIGIDSKAVDAFRDIKRDESKNPDIKRLKPS